MTAVVAPQVRRRTPPLGGLSGTILGIEIRRVLRTKRAMTAGRSNVLTQTVTSEARSAVSRPRQRQASRAVTAGTAAASAARRARVFTASPLGG